MKKGPTSENSVFFFLNVDINHFFKSIYQDRYVYMVDIFN